MPVTLKKRGEKFRVVERATGRIARKGKTPVDGGGHSSKDKGIRQVAAINSNLKGD